MIKNVLKIVFLGIVGFGGLVYLTAPEDRVVSKEQKRQVLNNLAYLPTHFELIGEGNYFRKEVLFPKAEEKTIIVLNHDALIVFNELDKYTNKDILLVANISSTPWLIKKLAVDGKLEELYSNTKNKLINDSSGAVVRVLGLNNIIQNKYFVYQVKTDGSINKSFEGDVKLDALQKGISVEEKAAILKTLVDKLK
ncbi:hypothetical protein ACH5BF_01100 [Arcobacter sp. YIC-464]|uniref:hypothetical protein n=1 Tax=Arcobacter sp. YIC-464 TaxID=3376631 RepID=UPI003C16D46F